MELLILISGDGLAMSPINLICSEMYPINFEFDVYFCFLTITFQLSYRYHMKLESNLNSITTEINKIIININYSGSIYVQFN